MLKRLMMTGLLALAALLAAPSWAEEVVAASADVVQAAAPVAAAVTINKGDNSWTSPPACCLAVSPSISSVASSRAAR